MHNRTITALAAVIALAATPAAAAELCPTWGPPEKVGTLDMTFLSNTSGLAASRAYPGRLYHDIDANQGGKFSVTDTAGGGLRTVMIPGYSPPDLEGIAVGPCRGAASCVYLGDFGDNQVNRTTMTFAILAEKPAFGAEEAALRIVTARYPDGPHNAEGFAIHPNGDLFLITKIGRAETRTRIFKLTAAQLAVADGSVQTLADVTGFELGGVMPTAAPARAGAPPRQLVATGFDISADGKTMMILTYTGAVELAFDLSRPVPDQAQWRKDVDFHAIATASLPQAEGVAYTVDGKSILYTSEFMNGGTESPIMRQRCLR